MIFTGWQLGTRTEDDPEAQAVRDHREVTMLLRAEVNALVSLLLRKQAFTEKEWADELLRESELLCRNYEQRFPGARATDSGMRIDPLKAKEWMGKWRP